MKKKEEMVTNLYAISIVAKKMAKDLLMDKGDKNVKNKTNYGRKRKCRKSYI